MIEIYKDVIGYEGIYQVSNLGNIKSFKCGKEKILIPSNDSAGYLTINLIANSVRKTRKVHQLVAESFLNHNRCGMRLVINHTDFNKANNKLDNLEIVTQRENANRKHIKSSSQYIGVCWNKHVGKWQSSIRINKKRKHLGCFINELDASEAYQKALQNIY